jgi:hypothetical protein
MRRRTARHARSVESQVKLMVFPIGHDKSSIYCAIPMTDINQVLNKGQHLNEANYELPRLDLQAYAFEQPIFAEISYTLILNHHSNLLWGLQIPILPVLVNVEEQSIKPFVSEDDAHPMRSVINRFVTLTDSETMQTLFLLDLDRLSMMANKPARE